MVESMGFSIALFALVKSMLLAIFMRRSLCCLRCSCWFVAGMQCMYRVLFTQSSQGKSKDIQSNLAMGMGLLFGVTVATQQALAEKAAVSVIGIDCTLP